MKNLAEAVRTLAREPKVHEVTHDGYVMKIRVPLGMEAVEFVKESSALSDNTNATFDFMLSWLDRLIVDPSGLTQDEVANAFMLMGGFTGPVAKAMTDMVATAAGIPKEKVQDLPFRDREGDGQAEREPDA